MTEPVLAIENLSVRFGAGDEAVQALDAVSFAVEKGEVLALVGESGCGKSVTMMAVMGLLPKRTARIEADAIRLGQTDLLQSRNRQLRTIRGRRIGMIFQDPMTSLNPVHTSGFQIAEVLRGHLGLSRRAARERGIELLDQVGIPDPVARFDAYPHELSGGMRQRVMIAMALACEPELLIADEPTTALDVTVQAQILELIADLRGKMGMSVVLITHDLGVVATSADRVAVMYAGRIVEEAPVERFFADPAHGYTAGLLQSLPAEGGVRQSRLEEIAGSVPRLSEPATGCAFSDRCTFATPECGAIVPVVSQRDAGHRVRCHHPDTVAAALAGHDIVRAWA